MQMLSGGLRGLLRWVWTGRTDAPADTVDPSKDYAVTELSRLAVVALAAVAASAICVAFALNNPWGLRSIGVVGATGLAAGSAGAVLGFLFGIPRVMTAEGRAAEVGAHAGDGAADPTGGPRRRLLSSNSNLEQVSDWLTKIIVGLSLVQAHSLNGLLLDFRRFVTEFVPPSDTLTPLVAVTTLIFATVVGFLWMYLETRLILSRIFGSVEEHLSRLLDEAREEKKRTDVQAQALTQAVLDLGDAAGDPANGLANAAESLKAAAASGEANSDLKKLAATALARGGRVEEARELLTPTSNDPATDVTSMQVALYEPWPDGFRRAIEIGGKLMGNAAANKRADFWFYLAAAFGQQFGYLTHNGGSGPELQSARDNALDAVRRAVEIDSGYRTRIYWLLHPDQSPNPEDNDLQDLAGDPKFEALATPPTPSVAPPSPPAPRRGRRR